LSGDKRPDDSDKGEETAASGNGATVSRCVTRTPNNQGKQHGRKDENNWQYKRYDQFRFETIGW